MAEATLVVVCPHCRHPYPMTPLQRDVYIGRNMGCMQCGRPFRVEVFQPRVDANPLLPSEQVAIPSASALAEQTSPAHPTPAAQSPVPRRRNPKWVRSAPVAARVSFIAGILLLVLIAAYVVHGLIALSTRDTSPWPMVANYTFLAAVAAGILAVISGLAAIALFKRGDGAKTGSRPRGRWMAITGLSLGGGGLVACAFLYAALLPAIARAREQSSRAACVTKLQLIHNNLMAYASTHGGRFPSGLHVLLSTTALTPDALVCPGSADTPATGDTPADEALDAARPGHDSYIYLASGLTSTAAPNTILAYESPDHHDGDMHVLFADGQIVLCTKPQAAQLLAELNAGQNPPLSAGGMRK
jgi:uncharacterized membrane protein